MILVQSTEGSMQSHGEDMIWGNFVLVICSDATHLLFYFCGRIFFISVCGFNTYVLQW